MPADVKILLKGYTNADSVNEIGEERTRATTTLVRDGDVVMVVDPGVLESQKILVDALAKENLTAEDVNFVCITHSHIDHYRNVGMFPYAKVLEYFGLWEGNTVKEWQKNFSENIQIIKTPGHDYTDITLFVTTREGVVAICGDVFWKENSPETPEEDQYASDYEKLKESREMVLEMSDWVIPGHGDIYKSKKVEVYEPEGGAVEAEEQLKSVVKCRKCGKVMERVDRCECRKWLCHHCCECGEDCDLCGCSHKKVLP